MSSTIPSEKKTESTTPIAVSGLIRVERSIPTIVKAPTIPAQAAPATSVAGSFAPVTRNATHTPGSAAWARASPTSERPRSTAKVPSTPAATPSSSAPVATTESV